MNAIAAGSNLHAPDGYHSLEKGVNYYFLRSNAASDRVLLIEFCLRPMKAVQHKSVKRPERNITPIPFPLLHCLQRSTFEAGIKDGKIKTSEQQSTLPPWLEGLEGLNLAAVDTLRKGAKRSHSERIDAKLAVIYPLIERTDEILESDDPDSLINQFARALSPKQNETRVRLWFYTYLTFGLNRFALHYPVHKIGIWDRMTIRSEVKRGRPGWRGKEFGYNVTAEMLEIIYTGYRRESGLGREMPSVITEIQRIDFGCVTRKRRNGKIVITETYQPQGLPFPEAGAIEYHIRKKFGTLAVAQSLLGRIRARSRIMPPKGAFTERTWNLMQRVVSDAYAVKELASGLIEGSPLPPLYVVERRDTASGIKTGIGFSQGGESAVAYRLAMFSESIDKVIFCQLFGITIMADQWPSRGVAPVDLTDRGPGARAGATSRTDEFRPTIRGMAPSYTPQSDADIEAAHPKHRKNSEAPSYVQSKLRTFELIRREIFNLLEFNQSADVRNRIPPDIADSLQTDTPIGLWNELASRGRNDAVLMSFSDAVRAFLESRDAQLTPDGIVLHRQVYKSAALDHTDARLSVVGKEALPIKVYFLDGCIRHIWLDWKGELIQVDLTFPVPVEEKVFYLSLAELIQFEQFCGKRVPMHAQNRNGVSVEICNQFFEQTGLKMNAGRRVPGRAKRGSRNAQQEAAETKAATRGRKSA
jgi:hypothetical protein